MVQLNPEQAVVIRGDETGAYKNVIGVLKHLHRSRDNQRRFPRPQDEHHARRSQSFWTGDAAFWTASIAIAQSDPEVAPGSSGG